MNRKWANYLRSLFYIHHLYRCTGLPADRYFYVVENKVVAYRDEPGPGECRGRPLSIVWYEPAPEDDPAAQALPELGAEEIVLHPCAGDQPELTLISASIAELSFTAGYYPPPRGRRHCQRRRARPRSTFLGSQLVRLPVSAFPLRPGRGRCREMVRDCPSV